MANELQFPEGYEAPKIAACKAIMVNGRQFTHQEWCELVERRPSEKTTDAAMRVARALGLGCSIRRD